MIFFEAKMLYRTVSEEVPTGDYTIPLGQARITRRGSDITLVGWGQQVAVLERAVCSIIPSPIPKPAKQPYSLSQASTLMSFACKDHSHVPTHLIDLQQKSPACQAGGSAQFP